MLEQGRARTRVPALPGAGFSVAAWLTVTICFDQIFYEVHVATEVAMKAEKTRYVSVRSMPCGGMGGASSTSVSTFAVELTAQNARL